MSREEFEKIYHLAVKRGIQLMTDECYCRFLYDSEPFSIAAMPGAKENVVVAGSLSKTYAMTGWRVGFALAPKPLIDAMLKLQSHTTSNPTSIAQKAAIEALRGPQDSIPIMLAEYRKRRDFVVQRLRAIPGVKIAEPRGAFYAYPNISVGFRNGITSALQFSEKLLSEAHVAVVPGEAFGTTEHVRISYATSMKELERGLDRIDRFIQWPITDTSPAAHAVPRESVGHARTFCPGIPVRTEKIGEVWFEADLPLLVKFVFTSERLSVQVHPNDDFARAHENSRGKTEMWYVHARRPGCAHRHRLSRIHQPRAIARMPR